MKVDKAVITVPAYFSRAQRDATERAGNLAGLQKVKLLKEPEAAALAYGLNMQKPQLVLVFDLGGGTLDVSVLEVGNGFVEVIATTGDSYLGGDDFDGVIVSWLLKQYAAQEGVTPAVLAQVREDATAMARLRHAAQEGKRVLSSKPEVSMQVPHLHAASGLDLKPVVLTRRGFESLSRDLLLRMLQPLREVAVMAGVNLPGESGQVGLAAEHYEEEDNSGAPSTSYRGEREEGAREESPDLLLSAAALRKEQVSGIAAARQRQKVMGSTQKELHRLQRSGEGAPSASGGGGGRLELFPAGRALDTVVLVGGATRMPCVRDAVRVMTGLTPLPHSAVHPDEAVCLGAGTLAGMLDGVIPDMQVVSHWQSAMLRFLQEEKSKGNDILQAKSTE
jgi:molecular chaperone DnaK (HSP70)